MPTLYFPSEGTQALSSIIHLLGVTVLTHCLSRRLASEDFSSWQAIIQTSWARLCILLVFLDSWLFLFLSGVLIFGVGLEAQHAVCSAAIYLCIAFYATSKILIYFYLIEKVHLVWSPSASSRLKSPVYIICLVTVCLYSVIIALMLVGRVSFLRGHDNACIIGLKPYSSIPLLTYDLYINVFLTALFIWPLLRSKLVNPRVRRVALRTLVASSVALTTSTVNMVVLTILKGHELGWVCLGSCGADVILNAFALFWVTGGGSRSSSSSGPSGRAEAREALPVELKAKATRRATMANAVVQPGEAYDYLPTASPVSKVMFNSPYQSSTSTSEAAAPGRKTHVPKKSASLVRTVAGLFRTKNHSDLVEEHDLKVQVTTEYNVDRFESVEHPDDEERKSRP